MKGYKVFNSDWTCRGFKYEVGETYEMIDKPEICKKGFHFCEELKDCFFYYPFDCYRTKIAEIEALGDIEEDNSEETSKRCTNKIRIVREIPFANLYCEAEYHTIKISDDMSITPKMSSVLMYHDGQYPILRGEGYVLNNWADSRYNNYLIGYNRIIDVWEVNDGI